MRKKTMRNYRKKTRHLHKGGSKNKTSVKCSPKPVRSNERKNPPETCYALDDLLKLKNEWNKRNPNNLIYSTTQQKLVEELRAKFADKCKDEQCWYKQFAELSDMGGLFAPSSPSSWESNPNEWLSSSDISAVMKQYTKIYKCFHFFGPAPIDFDKMISGSCVEKSLCSINIKELMDAGKFKIGISLNTDPHNAKGEHWISMFINIKKGIIFFFDSAGNKAPEEVVALSNKIIKQGLELTPPIKFKFDQNYPTQHQYTTTECGMYSLYFIISMLEDKFTQQYLKTHIITDKYIEKLRKIYYN